VIENNQADFSQPFRVLIIEDTSVDRHMLESMLSKSSGITSFLKSAASMSEAVKLLEQHDFDVVVLDLDLPDSQGEATLKNLREISSKISIVVNTGAYEDDLGLKTLGWGAQDFLIKGKYNGYLLNKVLRYAIERKRLEDELKEAYVKLKNTQEQLIQSEKLKVVGGLASGVAHEVKNPLATILYGATYLCEQLKEKDENIDKVLKNIREAVDRANNIITDLLDFSSLSRLNTEMYDLNDVVGKSLSLVNHQLNKHHIKIEKEFSIDLPKVNIDRNKIEQVLINLVLNSIYATTDNRALTLKTLIFVLPEDFKGFSKLNRKEFKPGDSIVIVEVLDEGCGISEDQIDKIFDPFFTSRRARGGVGLGLAVSKNIMEIHKGDILIENRKEGGVRARLIFQLGE